MADFKELLSKDTAGLPNWAWVLVVGAGITAAVIIPKLLNGKNSTGTTGTTATTGTDTGTAASGIGLATDPTTGLPYAVEGLVPSGGTSGTTASGNQQTTQQLLETGLIRTKNNNAAVAGYDKTNTGIPIRSGTQENSPIIGYEPYGSQVTLTGNAVTGGSNLPGKQAANGSTLWYQTMYNGVSGYISAYDLNGTPQVRPATWPNA